MIATANLLGYTGKVNIIEETETGYEIEILQGNYKGKRTFFSKNSKDETLTFPKEKFTSKIEYTVGKEHNEDTNTSKVYSRYLELTITARTEEIAEKIWTDCIEYLVEKANFNITIIGCPDNGEALKNKYYYYDSITIEDREEFEILKKLYAEWKKLYR